MQRRSLSSWDLCRLGILMEPDPADGHLYLLPRLVAARNYSRIGLARVRFNQGGDPVGVERLGVVLEPQEPYECNSPTCASTRHDRSELLAREWRAGRETQHESADHDPDSGPRARAHLQPR
jgi:hypothetical protein